MKPLCSVRRPAVLFLLLAAAACGPSTPPNLEVKLVSPADRPDKTTLVVSGVPSQYLPPRSEMSAVDWPAILRVTVTDVNAPGDVPPVAGSYAVEGHRIVFTPMFGFEPGVVYQAEFVGGKLPAAAGVWAPERIVEKVGIAKKETLSTTVVDHVYPSADDVPENQLRLYIQFSAPMGRKGGLEYVHLLDDKGREVPDPFLPLDSEFWNPDRTRYTVFFDPGRVKKGILPNRQMGRPLVAGRTYTLVVDREWKDGTGAPLKETFRRTFRAEAADLRPLDPKTWRMNLPKPGTRDPFTVTFPEPLDHGLLLRALGVTTADGATLAGQIDIVAHETQWGFRPTEPWKAGDYSLVALTFLEDMAGNRIGRAFEVDEFERVDPVAEEERVTLPFAIR